VSSVKATSLIATKCIKQKKSKKNENGDVGVIGVGNGKGGKGIGKGGDAAGISNFASNSTTSSNSTASTTDKNSTTIVTGTNSTRRLDSAANTTNSTVMSSSNVTMFVVVENSGGKAGRSKKGKGSPKVSADGVVYCEEDDDNSAVDSPSAPAVSPAVSPSASVGSPIGSPSTVTVPVVFTPSGNVASPVGSPSVPTTAQASVCEAYAYGEAPTSAPSQNYTAFLVMTVDSSSDIDSIYAQMGTVLREEIAPMLLNCDSVRRKEVRRQLQDNATELVNIRFTDPSVNTNGKFLLLYVVNHTLPPQN
jgi:hypothetical protein